MTDRARHGAGTKRQPLAANGVTLAGLWLLGAIAPTDAVAGLATVTTNSATASSSTVPGALKALDVLSLITVENEHPDGYERDLFAEGLDMDGDGCATRAEVLIRDTLMPPQIDTFGCLVLAGAWLSVYEGLTVTDPAALEVDHV